MKLKEFTEPDYSKMSGEELKEILSKKLFELGQIIQKSNNKIEHELRRTNSRTV